MSQFPGPVRRSGGEIDVYTGLLSVAFLVLVYRNRELDGLCPVGASVGEDILKGDFGYSELTVESVFMQECH